MVYTLLKRFDSNIHHSGKKILLGNSFMWSSIYACSGKLQRIFQSKVPDFKIYMHPFLYYFLIRNMFVVLLLYLPLYDTWFLGRQFVSIHLTLPATNHYLKPFVMFRDITDICVLVSHQMLHKPCTKFQLVGTSKS